MDAGGILRGARTNFKWTEFGRFYGKLFRDKIAQIIPVIIEKKVEGVGRWREALH